MSDNLTIEQRSKCMSNIKSKWTDQEKRIHNHLKSHKIKHQMHPNLPGSPDVLLKETNTAVFLHGCFWHKCAKCYKEPKSNKKYWLPKIEKNVKRDQKNRRQLRKEKFKTMVIWEHCTKKNFETTLSKLKRL